MNWYSSDRVTFGEYVWLKRDESTLSLYPLAECLSYVINSFQPLDYWLRQIFPSTEPHYAGGDPGWEITNYDPDTGEMLYDETGNIKYHAWTNEDISGLDPCEGEYDEATVKKHVLRTLENFRHAHPERTKEVDEVIARYQL